MRDRCDAVHDRSGLPLAMLGFSTAAWALAPRDRFIGWTPELRSRNLPLVIDNPRFLILPWIRIPNLGSHILALVRRRLPGDCLKGNHRSPHAGKIPQVCPSNWPECASALRRGLN